ncbi:uncharacterized protein LOC129001422 [Macrosteles quadrilineatus]|uniref:uncharacterized protein LOC129001422 n=1 Tax=Macrosteles quadrilineatus TaxID=74068 RepID=UPI0023E2F98C|nr:uncharacterized protein LOC129001422 [Macrosteles quadrilineatus]
MFQMAKEHNFKSKNERSIGLGTPGAGRPKSLKRKTKDSEDSFASYFDGVDHNIVEEDDSTPSPERTTMALFEVDPFEFMTTRRASGNRTYNRGARHSPTTDSPNNIDRWHRWSSDEQYPRVFTRAPPDSGSEVVKLQSLEASESVFLVDNDDDDEEPLLLVSRRPRFFITYPPENLGSTPWSQNARRWRNRPENHFLHKHTQQTMWDGWRKLGILEDRKKKKELEKHWNKLVEEEKEFQKELKERLMKRKVLRASLSVGLNSTVSGNGTVHHIDSTTSISVLDSVLERNTAVS